jgi:hypothetical protein
MGRPVSTIGSVSNCNIELERRTLNAEQISSNVEYMVFDVIPGPAVEFQNITEFPEMLKIFPKSICHQLNADIK